MPIARNEKSSTIGCKFNRRNSFIPTDNLPSRDLIKLIKKKEPHSDYSIARSELLNWVSYAGTTSIESGNGSKNNSIPDKEKN